MSEQTCLCGKSFQTEAALRGHQAKCQKVQAAKIEPIRADLESGRIKRMYETEGIGLPELVRVLNREGKMITYSNLMHILPRWGVTLRKISEANTPEVLARRFKTNELRYGGTNPLNKRSPSYQKKLNTVKRKYGVDNVRKCPKIKEKMMQTKLDRYGCLFLGKQKFTRTRPHREVESWLQREGIPFQSEVRTRFHAKLGEHWKSAVPDILIEELKLVVEIYGDYWHANPQRYLSGDLVVLYKGPTAAQSIWDFDAERQRFVESFGYKMITLWENEIWSGQAKTKLFEYIGGLKNEYSSNL